MDSLKCSWHFVPSQYRNNFSTIFSFNLFTCAFSFVSHFSIHFDQIIAMKSIYNGFIILWVVSTSQNYQKHIHISMRFKRIDDDKNWKHTFSFEIKVLNSIQDQHFWFWLRIEMSRPHTSRQTDSAEQSDQTVKAKPKIKTFGIVIKPIITTINFCSCHKS